MQHSGQEVAFIQGVSGLRLQTLRCLAAGASPLARVIFIHGFLEHSGRYEEFFRKLTGAGLEVVAFDLRGHGRSEGPRAWFRSMDELLGDLSKVVSWASGGKPEQKPFLIGHSLGGLITALWSIENAPSCRGVILLAPAVVVGAIPEWIRRLAPIVASILPWARIVRMGAKALSRDPRVVDDFMKDPLVYHGRIPTRSGYIILHSAARLRQLLGRVTVPFMVLHGSEDRICIPTGSAELFARASSVDKTFRLYPGLYHDLLHEPEAGMVAEDILRWIRFRL
ncbi:MAG: lysophospholipase [Thermoguttaceae bacterium]|nr:lysophospholipase [Thermoguttaceae bacterium]MDW8077274.1 alpha/beta hydrolase [Thermoguttaceae bacterium]